MTQDAVLDAVRAEHLDIVGTVSDPSGKGGAIVLLGPLEPGFWDHVSAQAEFQDGRDDPLDRWSERVIADLATTLGADAVFPFGGPPYHPFIRWALESGRCWTSPVGLLVHDSAGLMVSFRGALRMSSAIDGDSDGQNPCPPCNTRPCETACPVAALAPGQDYDVLRCKAHVLSDAGAECRDGGCLVRRACPVTQSYGRVAAQSAHHMRYFAQ